jgi:hypothetical protein
LSDRQLTARFGGNHRRRSGGGYAAGHCCGISLLVNLQAVSRGTWRAAVPSSRSRCACKRGCAGPDQTDTQYEYCEQAMHAQPNFRPARQ